MSITNGPINLAQLFNDNILNVPAFQRAYAWEKLQLRNFIEDISSHPDSDNKKYFFGTILLTLSKNQSNPRYESYDVVDGQQRLTTTCIFFAVATAKLRSDPSFSQAAEEFIERILRKNQTRKFHTISEDESFFEQILFPPFGGPQVSLNGCVTPSQKRLLEAKCYFEEVISGIDITLLNDMMNTLWNAQILVYAVRTNIEATQIFELQNDRGKRLTNLEALKSFLMHGLYVHAGEETESDLNIVQQNFADIYRNVEKMEALYDAPDEDQLLSYHCIAFEQWVTLEFGSNGWAKPKELIRQLLLGVSQDNRAAWIKDLSRRLKESYGYALQILQARDNYSCIPMGELSVLGRVASFWPLLLKTWKFDNTLKKSEFDQSVRLMESFTCRSKIAGKRSSTGEGDLRELAKEFTGGFTYLNEKLNNMRNGWDIPRSFAFNLDSENLYDWGYIATYLLWRYENHLRCQKAMQNPRLQWDTMVKPENNAVRYAKDHIEPKDPANPTLARLVKWDVNDKDFRPFADVYLHRLGNLVLDTISTGSAKGNGNFSSREVHYTANTTFLSQGEVVTRFAIMDPETRRYIWDETAIKNRQKVLVDFAINNL